MLAIIALLLSTTGVAQQRKVAPAVSTTPKPVVESPETPAGVRYVSLGKRDPFLNLLPKKTSKAPEEEESRGPRPPGIGGMLIDQVALLGIASQEGNRVAVFRGSDSRAYFLHEGDRLFDGSVTRISAETVTMLRETKYRSGKVLREEVTKRLRPL